MANEKNLKPVRSKSEAREKGRNGGVASGEARRARKTARQCAELYLSLPVSDMRRWNKMSREGVEPEDIDNMMLLVASMVRAGQEGDAAAFREVLKVIGEDKRQDEEAMEKLDGVLAAINEGMKHD